MAAINDIIRFALEISILSFLLYVGNRYWIITGGLINLLCGFLVQFRLFRPVLQAPVNAYALIKILSWIVAATGPVIALWIHCLLWGSPNNNIEFVAILIVTSLFVLETIDNIVNFKKGYFYVDEILQDNPLTKMAFGKQGFNQMLEEVAIKGGRNAVRSLARMQFVNMTIPIFFRYLINVGIL